jgi:8-oxo-dGTP diphosphatase
MAKVICNDIFGKSYEIEESEFIFNERVYGIFIKGGKILLVQDLSGAWEVPGGGVDHGETRLEALKREFKEETGLEVISKNPVLKYEHIGYYYALEVKQPWKSKRHFYLVEVKGGKLLENGNGLDSMAAGYFELNDLKNLKMKPHIKQALANTTIEFIAST